MIENVDFLSKTNLDVPKYDFQLPNTVNINEEINNLELKEKEKENEKKKRKIEKLISKEEEPEVNLILIYLNKNLNSSFI